MVDDTSADIGHVSADFLREAAKVFEPVKRRSYHLMRLRPGSSVLDIGSGAGGDVLALAALVGPEGKATGVDVDPRMVEAASAPLRAAPPPNIDFVAGSAAALPFPDETFDAVRSERTFQHLQHAERAVAEAQRVTRPGGTLVIVDPDYAGMSIDTSFPELERRFVGAMATLQTNGYSARRLPRQMAEAGVTDIEVELLPLRFHTWEALAPLLLVKAPELLRATGVSESAFQAFTAELAQRSRHGVLFAYVTMILTTGRRPHRPA